MIVPGHGNGAIALGHVARHGGNDVVGQANVAEADVFVTEVGGLGLGDIDWPHEFPVEQKMDHALAAGLGFLPDGSKLILGELTHVNQCIYQIIVFGGHVFSLLRTDFSRPFNLLARQEQCNNFADAVAFAPVSIIRTAVALPALSAEKR
jgi:hypothetical protein